MKDRNIILYVGVIHADTVPAIREWEKEDKRKFRVALLHDSRKQKPKNKKAPEGVDIVLSCDTSSDIAISKTLKPIRDQLLAVLARSDKNIPYFKRVIPHVPYMRTPTESSLQWSINKILMRRRMTSYNPSITPAYMLVHDAKQNTRKEVEEKVGFPLVVKPTNLEESLLVTICYHQEELQKALRDVIKKTRTLHKKMDRHQEPTVLVEQFMEGEMYSVDAYVGSRGKIYFCPLVHIKTGRSIGFDDFFGYQQTTPTTLEKSETLLAEEVSKKAIHALGLRNTSAHVELMKTNSGWKVIELGPRLGGFRSVMYRQSYNIKHVVNDIRIRIPEKPIIPKKVLGYSAVMKVFGKKEGTITKMTGVKKLENLKSFRSIKVNKKVGDQNRFAKNGGRSVFNITLFNKERDKLLADIRRIEQSVVIEIK